MPVGPTGYTPSTGAEKQGTAHSRHMEMGKGRPAPREREMPYARHMGLKVFVGTHASDSLLAAEDAIADFQDWAQDDEQATAVVQDVTFEFVTETKMALYVIYSN